MSHAEMGSSRHLILKYAALQQCKFTLLQGCFLFCVLVIECVQNPAIPIFPGFVFPIVMDDYNIFPYPLEVQRLIPWIRIMIREQSVT